MQLSIQQSEFNAALGRVKSAVANRSSLPVLLCVKLSTGHGVLRLDVTDLEIAITTDVAAMVEEDGAVAIPYALLAQVVSQLPDERIAMVLDPATLTLTLECGKYTTRIHGLAVEDFPAVNDDDGEVVVSVPAAKLLRSLGLVAFAAARDESRPVLTGVLVESVPTGIRLVAADGFRLSVDTITMEHPPQDVRLLIPVRAMDTVRALSGKSDGDIAIAVVGTKVRFVTDGNILLTRTIDGAFPDWEKVVPTEWKNRAIANREEFLRAIKLAAIFAAKSQNITKLEFTPKPDGPGGEVKLSANTQESGDATALLHGVQQGDATVIAVNVTFLRDVVAAIQTYQVELHTQSPEAPLVVLGLGDEDYRYIIMPMTLR